MSEKEDENRHKVSGESSVVVMQHTADRIKSYRPNELENEPGERHKWSKTPAVPSVAEEIQKGATNNQTSAPADTQRGEKPDRKKEENVSAGPRGQVSKMLSAMAPAPGELIGTEAVVLTNLQKDPVYKVIPPPAAPVDIKAVPSGDSVEAGKAEDHADEDSITDEIGELPATATDTPHRVWSDDQEAGGLPRSQSRTSRVSRVVRHFLCCSAVYSPASEDDISTTRVGSGI